MIKRVISLFFFLFLVSSVNISNAQEKQFDLSVDALYEVEANGITSVTQEIAITNKTEFYFTPSYTAGLGINDISNIEAYNSDGTIPATIEDDEPDNKKIKLTFQSRYAGLNKTNTFTLKFKTQDIAKKIGNVWEVNIPGLEDSSKFSSYTTTIKVPEDFGDASIVKPYKKISQSSSISFNKAEIGNAGIYVLFGQSQYYKFELKYNISNPNLFPVKTEIALPPSTNYQNSIISDFSEDPANVIRDFDGNWIAEYSLLPQQKKTIIVKGVIETLSSPRTQEIDNKQNQRYTSPLKYWDSKDDKVLSVAKDLNDVEDIYDFVVKTLSYNNKKIATENLRLGGKGSLGEPTNSVCLEFTDLFISLARAKGIPARAVEGFAFTNNSKLRPVSLVNDILHAWPEYYDKETKKWIMIDPTWGKTTNGIDYFTSLDFSHVTFAVKGVDSQYPIPAGGYKFSKDSKDVSVSFASKDDFKPISKIVVDEAFPDKVFPKFAVKGTINIKNTGNVPQENLNLVVQTSSGSKRQFFIDYIPPYGSREITTSFSDTPFLTTKDYNITIHLGDKVIEKKIKVSFIPDLKFLLIVGGIIGVSTITAAVTFHTGSLLVQKRKEKSTVRR